MPRPDGPQFAQLYHGSEAQLQPGEVIDPEHGGGEVYATPDYDFANQWGVPYPVRPLLHDTSVETYMHDDAYQTFADPDDPEDEERYPARPTMTSRHGFVVE